MFQTTSIHKIFPKFLNKIKFNFRKNGKIYKKSYIKVCIKLSEPFCRNELYVYVMDKKNIERKFKIFYFTIYNNYINNTMPSTFYIGRRDMQASNSCNIR